jgi:hypothetical protein
MNGSIDSGKLARTRLLWCPGGAAKVGQIFVYQGHYGSRRVLTVHCRNYKCSDSNVWHHTRVGLGALVTVSSIPASVLLSSVGDESSNFRNTTVYSVEGRSSYICSIGSRRARLATPPSTAKQRGTLSQSATSHRSG